MALNFSHPTGKANFTEVIAGSLTVWFSYETPIAFRDGYGAPVIMRENDWQTTTGRHLNYVSSTADRISGDEFTKLYTDVLIRRGLSI